VDSDKTCEKLITRKVFCFLSRNSKLSTRYSMHSTRTFDDRASRIEDRVSKFELRGTVNLHLHGTVHEPRGFVIHIMLHKQVIGKSEKV